MQITVKFFKVLGLPTEPVPNAIYFVESGSAIEIYVTGDDGIVKNAGSPALVQALMDASDALVYKGVIDASANPNYPAADAGHTYRFSVSGKIGGASGVNVTTGDMMICVADGSSAGDHATSGAHWNVIERNLDGAVIGPSSATHNGIPQFQGGSGKLIKNSGVTLAELATIDSPNFTGNPKSSGDLLVTEALLLSYAVPRLQGAISDGSSHRSLLLSEEGTLYINTRSGGATAELPSGGLTVGKSRFFIQFTGGIGQVTAGGIIEYGYAFDSGSLSTSGLPAGNVSIAQYAVGEFFYKDDDTWVMMGTFHIL